MCAQQICSPVCPRWSYTSLRVFAQHLSQQTLCVPRKLARHLSPIKFQLSAKCFSRRFSLSSSALFIKFISAFVFLSHFIFLALYIRSSLLSCVCVFMCMCVFCFLAASRPFGPCGLCLKSGGAKMQTLVRPRLSMRDLTFNQRNEK